MFNVAGKSQPRHLTAWPVPCLKTQRIGSERPTAQKYINERVNDYKRPHTISAATYYFNIPFAWHTISDDLNLKIFRTLELKGLEKSFIPPSYSGLIQDIRKSFAIKVYKATGCDQIPPRAIKESAEILCHPFSQLFNYILNKSRTPQQWKLGEVTPAFLVKSFRNVSSYKN